MRVLIVGGSGHIGSYIVDILNGDSRFEVVIGSRFPERHESSILLRADEDGTFGAADSFDVVINCTDTFAISPVPLFKYCMNKGICFIETTADTSAYQDMYDAFELMPTRIAMDWA